MPLTLKISGFKSFCDPTVIPLLTNLTAIVGPNGCGKSNIMDAMRWVLGEISAKHMRGESMSDIIFNGSANRKPLGQASVEMIFDNSTVNIGGEYARYNEIAIRREVTRDGISNYYFNSAPCRRKDILNIFLGTGLKYSIIEQGMVSQIVEANPEELRTYLEEAAGISKYKERRRETENRIAHTKDNLARLSDISNEIESQLKVLKKQSNLAAVYKKLREELRLLKAKSQALGWYFIDLKIKKIQDAAQKEDVLLQQKLASQRELEAHLEKQRQEKNGLTAALEEVQNRFYVLGSNIVQLEQRIHYNQERKTQLAADLEKLQQAWDEAQSHKNTDAAQIELLQNESLALRSNSDRANEELAAAEQALRHAEREMSEWQSAWEGFNQAAAKVIQQTEIENTRLNHIRATIQIESDLIAKLENEAQALIFTKLQQEIENLSRQDAKFRGEMHVLKETLNSLQHNVTAARLKIQTLTNELNHERREFLELQGKKSALDALQKNALGGSEQKITEWLKDNGLSNSPRLAQELTVDAGWEKAVEAVLGNYLEAVCHDELQSLLPLLPSLQNIPGDGLNFFLFDPGGAEKSNFAAALDHPTLTSKIHARWKINDNFSHIYCVDDLEQGLKLYPDLKVHESVVTRDGIWFGSSWLRVPLKAGNKTGVLQREQELRSLQKELDAGQNALARKESELQEAHRELADLEKQQHLLQQEFHQHADRKGEVNSALNVKQANLNHMQERAKNLQFEILEHKKSLTEAQNHISIVEKSWRQLCSDKDTHEKQREKLILEKDRFREKLDAARNIANKGKETADALNMRLEVLRNQIVFLKQSLQRAEKQLQDLGVRRNELETSLQAAADPAAQFASELETKLTQRSALEKDLISARVAAENADHAIYEQEKARALCQEEAELVRERLAKLRIEKQGMEVNAVNHAALVEEQGFQLQDILPQVLPELEQGLLDQQILSDKIEKNNKRIERLGPINLAAIDEYNRQRERKAYLDAQNEDLLSALATLENAIRKIDSETRSKLQTTFDQVNSNLQALFPKIFGGGKAHLQLAEHDDLLHAGMTIWAQPPGKRNSTIHLLSGGEKALTAVALLFAIFQINPAPFCLLDEVDAPFDDENIGRFCKLVKEMSQSIQFIYISHNKLSMEIADQLLGVTMHEPGVSRIVSVDVEQAIKMAGEG